METLEEILRKDPSATQPVIEDGRERVDKFRAVNEAFFERLGDRRFYDTTTGNMYEFTSVIMEGDKPVIQLQDMTTRQYITVDETEFKFNPAKGAEKEFISERFELVRPIRG